jgi:hypothetical protein
VDQSGFLVENSATLSACAWAVGRLHRTGSVPRDWLDGFGDEQRTFSRTLDPLTPPSKDSTSTSTSQLGGTAHRIGEHTKGAAVEAIGAGAKATGAAVTAVAASAVTVAAGPVLGGIAGAVTGAFVEKLLTPGRKNARSGDDGRSHDGNPPARLPDFVLNAAALHAFVADLANALGVADLLSPSGVRVECVKVPVKSTECVGEQPFLNSFIADDLAVVAKAVASGDMGEGLTDYLADGAALSIRSRIDVREQRQRVADDVAPCHQPPGRWPTDISRPLVMSQQFAVNKIMQELGSKAGVFAVNGPPGTGKTTLLRDVIAAVVVDRARTLASLRRPTDAFGAVIEQVRLGERYTAAVRSLQPDVAGSEILVATNGNDAAANVTAQIPGIAAVGNARAQAVEADYFSALASQVLDAEAWGLLAATLGSRKNCATFVKRFWWGDSPGRPQANLDPAMGMMAILREARREPATLEEWSAAVDRFRTAEADVRRLTEEREGAAAALRHRPQWAQYVDEVAEQLQHLTNRAAALREATDVADRAHTAAGAALEDAAVAYREHREDKPGFWVSLSTGFRAGRDWDAEHQRRKAAYEQAEVTCRNRQAEVDRLTGEGAATDDKIRAGTTEHGNALSTLAAIDVTLCEARKRWPNCVPDPDAHPTDGDALELCTPWADGALTSARNRLTLEALRLHKAFILGTSNHISANLSVAAAVLDGSPKVGTAALRAAWQTLFLVVPVISTTFASLPRLLGGLGRDSLGWLFIDEAGQATAQQAVGGLWRARRTVVVGDPQQLEPIVALPVPAQRSLLRHYAVAEEWLPSATSVQRVADRLNTYGTLLDDPIGHGSTWIGAPLRVHRRSDHLMFDVANRIAYGGTLMVFGTPERQTYPGHDQWIDVPTGRAEGKWVPQEGEALGDLLGGLRNIGIDPRDVRIISPFRDVVNGAKRTARTAFGAQFAADNVGTIHTVQGQEAEVVIIVLGSSSEAERARRWAAEKPNLLNVAVSRARRRLYVIGDRSRWSRQRYFSVLSDALPTGTGTP